MSGPEAKLTKAVLAYLRRRPDSWTAKLGAGPYQRGGLPDVIHVEGGRLYAFELKAPTGRLTVLQSLTLQALNAAGATARCVRSVEEVRGLLESNHE